MTTPDILQMSLDAKALKFVSEFLEKEHLDKIRLSELISLCGPRIKNQRQKYDKMKELVALRPDWNWKELAPKLQVARQTLYNWRDEGWMVTTDSGKPDLKKTIRLWEELNWVTGHNLA